ncbi:ubiquinol-cytochrome c reductase core subunit 1 [Boothiomyces macroporosus]|uniref:Cilia- and flagella-associated protein 53 n=1 Tax=Boothiomyces macroporosus TaxID=261099 RepID=A0AAD5Y650_9FUNG|nr:ubiquinol-cytochrome c reductase core subunit 1 [Boothiomyces macroporosus]
MLRNRTILNQIRAQSSVSYNRKGEQVAAAPKAVKTVSKTPSGVTLATYDHLGPVSSVAVYLKAGSRYESPDAPGVAHLYKRLLVRDTPGDSAVRNVLEAQLRGNSLYTTVSREHISVGSEFLRDDVVDAVPLLISQVFNPSLEVYEFLDALNGTASQSASALACRHVQTFEKLHQVAFRTGLGNSVFASKEALSGFTRAEVKAHSKYLTPDRIAVVATGVAHTDLQAVVENALSKVSFAKEAIETPKAKYFGGEARLEAGPNSLALYAVAYPGVAYTSEDYSASLVLRALLDQVQNVKWGSQSEQSTVVSGFSNSYVDTGLVGFIAEGKTGEIKAAVQKSIAALKGFASAIPADVFEAAKKAAVVTAETELNRQGLVEALGKEATSGKTTQLLDVANIKSVTAADVQKIVKAAIASKPSVVASGNLLRLPYADELSDFLITNRRKDEDLRQQVIETRQYYENMDRKSQFEQSTTFKINRNRFLQKLNALRGTENNKLEQRREKLRQLLAQDEIYYRQALLKKEETTESRIKAMKERMTELRLARENERKAVVKQKLDQQWRQGCDELRQLESKILVKQVAKDRALQLIEKEERRALEKKEAEYYDKLWEQGRLEKEKRERRDHQITHERNVQTLVILQEQLESLKKQARLQEELKAEEARLMDMQMRQMEDERILMRKEQEKRAIRADLDEFNKAKILQRQQDVKKALDNDLRILDEISRMEKAEKESHSRRKLELQKEMQLYREHLTRQKAEEAKREKELEQYYNEEQDRIWKVRTEKWRKEQAARDKLMQDVIKVRQEQLQAAIERNKHEQELNRLHKIELEKEIEKGKLIEAEENAKSFAIKQKYSKILADQIEEFEQRKVQEKLRRQKEFEAEKAEYEKYDELLQAELGKARLNLGEVDA